MGDAETYKSMKQSVDRLIHALGQDDASDDETGQLGTSHQQTMHEVLRLVRHLTDYIIQVNRISLYYSF